MQEGVSGSVPVSFFFVILGVMELSLAETMIIGASSAGVTSLLAPENRKVRKIALNVANAMTAILCTYFAFGYAARFTSNSIPLMLIVSAMAYFVVSTVPMAAVTALSEKRPFRRTWTEGYMWSFPYYVIGAGISGGVSSLNVYIGWQTSLLIFPVVYWIYRSYFGYLERLEEQKRHVESMAALHLRTIEALALAIEAKDHTTHDHLQRVRIYAIEIGNELKLNDDELEALKAASLLHDIGKLAIPEHILNKPGRLTREEFEKMKIHPLVGAEILERVDFPYPVVPLVRAHHERFDGTGYPLGLKGEEIPMGARILSAVDSLDSLASDRQYRPALPLDEAMKVIEEGSGTEFDPRVVEVLKRRYLELEELAQNSAELMEKRKVFKAVRSAAEPIRVETSGADSPAPMSNNHFVYSIAAARQEAQTLFELSHELGNSLSLDETLSVLSSQLKKLVPFDSIVIYLIRGDQLLPEHVKGDNFRLFSSLEIPFGQGLSGWVAASGNPIVNGSPSLEPGYVVDSAKYKMLRSATAVPLEGANGVLGVLSLYKEEADAFTRDHLRILLAISSKVALSCENALKYQQAESSATTDYLTGLPNARSLFLHMDKELARCERSNTSLAVMVCDLDGFKQINDRFGHLEGNKVLKTFAAGLRAMCREYDYVARMGGDEFIVIAPGMTNDAADERAVAMNELASQAGREVCGRDALSVSVGVAFAPKDGDEVEELLAEADRRMYVVKQVHHEELEIKSDGGNGSRMIN